MPCNRGIGVNRGHYRGPSARGRRLAPSVQESSIYGGIQGVEAVEAGGSGAGGWWVAPWILSAALASGGVGPGVRCARVRIMRAPTRV